MCVNNDRIPSECTMLYLPRTFYHMIKPITFIFISFPRGQVGISALGTRELRTLSGSLPTRLFLSKLWILLLVTHTSQSDNEAQLWVFTGRGRKEYPCCPSVLSDWKSDEHFVEKLGECWHSHILYTWEYYKQIATDHMTVAAPSWLRCVAQNCSSGEVALV